LAVKVQEEKEARVAAESQVQELRGSLITGIAGPSADLSLYKHAPLMELLRIFSKQIADTAVAESVMGRPLSRASRSPSRGASRGGPRYSRDALAESPLAFEPTGGDEEAAQGEEAKFGETLEGEEEEEGGDPALRAARLHNFQLSKKLEQAAAREQELQHAADEASQLQQRAIGFANKYRSAQQRVERAESAAAKAEERVEALSRHVEKLMRHLEHEATAKAKTHEEVRRAEAVVEKLRGRNAQLARANQERDRLILELKEGSKILEDQLRLMDQKYVELRGKIDWLRSRADKQVKMARKQAEVVERAWLELQASGVIPRKKTMPPLPAPRLDVPDPPGMPGADDSVLTVGTSSSSGFPPLPRKGIDPGSPLRAAAHSSLSEGISTRSYESAKRRLEHH
jgi:DNA repair exonuclease SbcCD ATPase subunit